MSTFYTQNGFEGSRYDSKLTTTDIAKEVRNFIKKNCPGYKFSVTVKNSTITVALMAYPVELTNKELMTKYVDKISFTRKIYSYSRKEHIFLADATKEDKVEYVEHLLAEENYKQLNHYQIENETWINPEILDTLKKVNSYVKSFNYDDSDAMIDYFDTNFYYHMDIGKWNKPAVMIA